MDQSNPTSVTQLFNQETLQQLLRTLIEGVHENWTHAIFWQSSVAEYGGSPVFGWGDGYYKNEENKMKHKTAPSPLEHRKRVQWKLNSLISGSQNSADNTVDEEDVILLESPGSLDNPKRILIVMDALKEFSFDLLEWVFRNFTLKECCTVTVVGIMPWLNIPLSSKTWSDVWSMNLENLDYLQEKREGKNDSKCQKVQRLMDLSQKYGVMPEIRTEMGHPLRQLVVEQISSLHATLVVFDRYHDRKNIEYYAGKVPCNLVVVNDNGSVDLIKKHKPVDSEVHCSPAN